MILCAASSATNTGLAKPAGLVASFDEDCSPSSLPVAAEGSSQTSEAGAEVLGAGVEAAVGMRVLPLKQRPDEEEDDPFLPMPTKTGKKKGRNRGDSGGWKQQGAAGAGAAGAQLLPPPHSASAPFSSTPYALAPTASPHDAAGGSPTGRTPPRGWGAAGRAGGASAASSAACFETLEEIQQREAQEQRRKHEARRADMQARRAGAAGAASWPAMAAMPSTTPPRAATGWSVNAGGDGKGAPDAGDARPARAEAHSRAPTTAAVGSPLGAKGGASAGAMHDALGPGAEAKRGKGADAGADDGLFWGPLPGAKSKGADKATPGAGAATSAANVVAASPPSAGSRGGWAAGGSGATLSFSLLDLAPQARPPRKGKARQHQQAAVAKAAPASLQGDAQRPAMPAPSPPQPSLASIQAEEEQRVDKSRLHRAKIKNKVALVLHS
jgi:hypothetical protein